MKQTMLLKLVPTEEQSNALLDTMYQFNAAANYVASIAWASKTANKFELQKLVYGELRTTYKLAAQLAIRCISKASEAYKRDKSIQPTFKPEGAIVYLAVTLEVPTPAPDETTDTLGVDLGIVNLATDSDGETFSGEQVEKTRKRMSALRQRLQKRGTKSAKRHLKKLSGKEARFKRDTNHIISKRIVQKVKTSGQGIAIEELRHIRKRTDSTVRRSQRSRHSSWSFGQLRSFLSYKAALVGVPLHTINPRNTSRTCPACGHCAKANRTSQAGFRCVACGCAGNADQIAAEIIRRAAL